MVLTVAGAATGGIGVLLLVFGVMATGSTRRNVYSGATSILSGRCTAAFVSIRPYTNLFVTLLCDVAMVLWLLRNWPIFALYRVYALPFHASIS